MEFEWDERKRQATIIKHGLDFVLVTTLFDLPHVIMDSRNQTEVRKLIVGLHNQKLIAVVFTMRGECTRLITARGARENERRAYRQIHH